MGKRFSSLSRSTLITGSFAFAVVSLVTLGGCSFSLSPRGQDPALASHSLNLGQRAFEPLAERALIVVGDDSKPVGGADVLIGSMPGAPFSGNALKADADGKVLVPELWKSNAPITIDAPGYVRTTFLAMAPSGYSLAIRRESPAPMTVKGRATGFGNLKSNGTLDVGLVFESLKRSELSLLDLTTLISPDVDREKVYGFDVEIPANLSIPQQSESIFLFVPVALNKPEFRTRVSTGTQPAATVAALGVQFDFKKMIDDMKDGKSFFDLINRLQFRSYSVRALQTPAGLAGVSQTLDLPINEIPITAGPTIQAGVLPSGYAMLATSLADHGGSFVVTDVKRLLSGEKRNLGVSGQGKSSWVVRTLKKYEPQRTDFAGSDYEELSSISMPGPTGATGAPSAPSAPVATLTADSLPFLPIVKPPSSSGRSLLFSPPKTPQGLAPAGTHLTLSKLQFLNKGAVRLVDKTPLWDFWSSEFISQIDLPAVKNDPWSQTGQYRWELVFSAKPVGSGDVTHSTRASVDFLY